MNTSHPFNKAGKVIFLNGATSSGKSTIAALLQARIDEPFWHFSIDHFREAGILPLDRIRSGEFDWKELRASFFDGFHRALAAYVAAGNNLIIEHVIETKQWLDLLVEQLAPFDIYFVGIHCPLDELERREAARGDRPIGGARQDFETAHARTQYDLELDGTLSADANVIQLLEGWKRRTQPSAFSRMMGDV